MKIFAMGMRHRGQRRDGADWKKRGDKKQREKRFFQWMAHETSLIDPGG